MDTRVQDEKQFWEKQAAKYDAQVAGLSAAYAKTADKIKAYANPGSRVLDAACGTGILSLAIAPFVARVDATDLSPNMVEVAKGKAAAAGNICFAVADAYALPFDDESFDVAVLANVLHVVKEPAAVLAEMRRVLKPGGALLAATDCTGEKASGVYRILLPAQRLLKLVGAVKYMRRYKKTDIDALLQTAGFAIAERDVLHDMPVNYFVAGTK